MVELLAVGYHRVLVRIESPLIYQINKITLIFTYERCVQFDR